MNEKITKIVDEVSKLTVLQLVELIKLIEDKFDVKASMIAPIQQIDIKEEVEEKEQTEFTITLLSSGEKKIQVIKVVRALMSLGIKEAKDFVDSAPKVIREGISKNEALDIKKNLEDSGAIVSMK